MVVTQQLQLKLQKQAQFQQISHSQTVGGAQQSQTVQQQQQQHQQVLQQLQQQQQQLQTIQTIQQQQPQQQSQMPQQMHHQPTVGQTMIIPSAGGVTGLIVQANKQHRRGSATTEANK